MNLFRGLGIFLIVGSLLFNGCGIFDSSHKSATQPPPPPPSQEIPSTQSPPQAVPPDQAEATPPSPTDADLSQPVPIKDLPKKKGYPYAIKTKWPGLVKSPYAQDKQLVDVSSMASGTPARCPHTGKIFIVP